MGKKLRVKVNQGFKLFESDTEYEMDGDLIILSGINGSGKSQFIDIISKTSRDAPKNAGRHNLSAYRINSDIEIDGQSISDLQIFKRTFWDNEYLPDIAQTQPRNSVWHKDQAWGAYSNFNTWNGGLDYYDKARSIIATALENNGYPPDPTFNDLSLNNTEIDITENEFKRILPDNFLWQPDDLFTNRISEIFYDFAAKRQDEKARLGELSGGFDNVKYNKDAPWMILNKLFQELRFGYRFKDDYEYRSPNLVETPTLFPVINGQLDESQPRQLSELSDGEKSIISLTLASFNEAGRNIEKILLLDEFDNTLNPSLIEAFYKVIEEFFIKRDVLVIIVTHSPATISLAPSYTEFYEAFRQDGQSPKILKVQRSDYAELQLANKDFYDKITNQASRIKALETDNQQLSDIIRQNKPMLLVEDKYSQIYKIAYLKLNNISFTENNLADVFDTQCPFTIIESLASGGVYGALNCENTDLFRNKKMVGLFDYDNDAVKKFHDLQKQNKKYDAIQGNLTSGLHLQRKAHGEMHGLLLPIPNRLEGYTNKNVWDSDASYTQNHVEIETLLPVDVLSKNPKCRQDPLTSIWKVKDDKKKIFWKDCVSLAKNDYLDFEPLFAIVSTLFNIQPRHPITQYERQASVNS